MSQYLTNPISTSGSAIAPLELTVSRPGWDGGERHVFEQPFVLIGRDERSCLRLDDDAVSRRHAYLQQIGERIFCIDLGSRTGMRWAGESRPAGWLLPNQEIQIGPFTLELVNGAWTSATPNEQGAEAANPLQDRRNGQPQLPRFRIAVGNEIRSQFRMNRDLVLVGSAPDCRVRLRDAGISRYHCSLVKTPEGLWVIDLLSATGTRLNGQPVRWARVNEGDLLRVGQYLLRLGYEGEGTAVPSMLFPVQGEEDGAKSGQMSELMPALQAELEQLRERLRDAEILRQHLAERETECVRLREQAHTFDKQTAEVAELKARLDVSETLARKLEEVCSERDHWQTQTHALQTQIASDSAEREDLRQQLEAAQQQIAEEREAARAANVRLDQQSVTLQQLQETHEELARERDKTRQLQAELDQASEHLRDAEALRHQLADARSKHDELIVRFPELEDRAASAERLKDQLRNANAETEQLREQLQATESRMTELEVLRTECAQLREQSRAFEIQVAEMEDLKGRHESTAGKLADVCGERDHWQAKAQTVQAQIESGLAEREELRQRLEAAQRQLAEEREAVRVANVRLDQQSATLQQLQETHQELARAHDKTRELLAELDQARHHQQDAEALRHQLTAAESKQEELVARVRELEGRAASTDQFADRLRATDAETERLRHQVHVLELRVAEADDLIARFESTKTDAHNLEEVSSERDRWQVEAQTLRNRIASDLVEREQFVRLTGELLGVQAERDRLLAEQQTSSREVAESLARVADVERALTEATAAYQKALTEERAGWESERKALKTLIEQAGTADNDSAQTMVREVQARFAAERQELKLRLEGAEAQILWERGLAQEQSEQLRRQVSTLQAERERLAARLTRSEPSAPAAEVRSRENAVPPAETNSLRQLTTQDQALALFFGMGTASPLGQPARTQGTNKPVEPGRPPMHNPNEWSQVAGQGRLTSIEQGVEDAWVQASSKPQGPAIQADAGQESNSPDTTQGQPDIVEENQSGEVIHACLSPIDEEKQQGLWGKILNLVRRK